MSKPTNVGSLQKISLKIDAPIPMDMEIEMNKLNLFTGTNGTGKSLILKLSWVLSTIVGISIAKKKLPALAPASINELAQYTFDKSFSDQNFNGEITGFYEHGIITVNLSAGKIESLGVDTEESIEHQSPTIFMSTDMRTFDQIKQFLKIEKVVNNEEELTQFYKLYDIAYVKFLQKQIAKGYTASQSFKDMLKDVGLDKLDLQSVHMTSESVFYTNSKGEVIDLATLSKGEQSLINMALANTQS